MSSLADLIREARERADLSQTELADKVGVTRQAINKIESGATADLKMATALAIGAVLRVDVYELARAAGWRIARQTQPAHDLVLEEPSGATYVVELKTREVPVVGTAQLGDDGYWLELGYPTGQGDGFVRYPTKDRNSYALRVKGDSMRPRIKPGEFVIIEPNTAVTPGDEVLVKTTDGRSMVKVLGSHRDGQVELLSLNEAHRHITLDDGAVETMHYVAGIVKSSLYHRT